MGGRLVYGVQLVRKSSRRMNWKGLQVCTLNSAATSGILRLARCFDAADTSAVTIQ